MSRPSSDMIERVVREVLAELRAKPEPGASGAPCSTTQSPSPHPPTIAVVGCSPDSQTPTTAARPTSPDVLAIASRVVTMDDVLGRLGGVRRVLVSRGSIVTPAVRDELLRRGIALEQTDSSQKRSTTTRLALVVARVEFDPAPLAAALVREGFLVEPSASDCLMAATDQLAREAAKPDTLGVLISRHTAVGLCLANRRPGVRAIGGVDAPSVAASAAAVGANLLVVDPRILSFFQLKQMITEFGRGGVRPCPEVFRGKLA